MSRLPLAHVLCASLLSLSPCLAHAESYVLSTVAGASTQGFADGVGPAARFALPQGIARAPNGTIYVADTNNYVVRQIATDGTVTTLAGLPGVHGYVDATGGAARFGSLFGISVDSGGIIYVSDNHAIRRITPAGVVNTLAGSPNGKGSVDAVGTAARFSDPRGLAVDSARNIYVADVGNFNIRKIATDGTVTTFAGSAGNPGSDDGVGTAARFRLPYGIAVDANRNVYVADWEDATIRKITPDGTVSTFAGSPGLYGAVDGTGGAARFDSPDAIAVDTDGYLYVSDRVTKTIRAISPAGVVRTIAGQAYLTGYRDGVLTEALFDAPTGVAVGTDYLYIADSYNSTIRRVDTHGNVTTFAGQTGAGTTDGIRAAARFFKPQALAIDPAGNVYVADTYNHTIRKMAPDGTVTTLAGLGGARGSVDGSASDARFRYPDSVAVDSAGNVYVADSGNHVIRKITPGGIVGTLAGLALTSGSDDGVGGAARFNFPSDIRLDPSGNLVVADSGNHTLRRVTPTGSVTTIAGQAGVKGDVDGPATSARFNRPYGIGFDRSGNLYIADSGSSTIRKMTPAGIVTTLAGRSGETGDSDGAGGEARFDNPSSVAADADGNVYVADLGNNNIRKITPGGTVTTIAGSGYYGSADGIDDSAELFYPTGVACDAFGNVYVADQYNHVIRKLGLTGVATPGSRLFNLSVRANLVANERLMTGFVLTGNAKPMLVRAIGPGLKPYVGNAVTASNPRLEVYDSAVNLIVANEDWEATSSLLDAFGRVGAFPLSPGSLDAAVVRDIAGLNFVHVLTPGAGMGIVECYDSGDGTTSRLINVSARYHVDTGDGALFAGFVIIGDAPKTVLIRGIGPTLSAFGVGGTLPNPRLTLYMQKDGVQQKIAENDDWAASLTTTFNLVNAFELSARSKDSTLLISLPPGQYTAQLNGTGTETGEGMIEVYEVGN